MDRRSGILMHLSSLPGPFGSGGLGRNAERFADFLKESGFRVWQVLPTTPTDRSSNYSPYSSQSAFAGNQIFVSPEKLVEDGLLEDEEVAKIEHDGLECRADFDRSTILIKSMLNLAWRHLKNEPEKFHGLLEDYYCFIESEKYWLQDYALFTVLKKKFDGLPWNKWPQEFAQRDKEALENFIVQKETCEAVEFIYFGQYILYRQWKAFHLYCSEKDIKLMGDIPMFAALDSSDVWSNQKYFDLDYDGFPNKVAGVPPDYFSNKGQRWGNPLYNWENMQKDGYGWWVSRFKKALENFDLLRIDHFRGFSACWAIPVCEETAENGQWIETPGRELLAVLADKIQKNDAAELPLIAEDLGIITDDVRGLMNLFGLPGMKVLLFAFNDDVASNPYAPHNHVPGSVVYTGTHDNNTVRGWWENESDERSRSLVSQYTVREITKENVAEVFAVMALSSTSKVAIVPMQDILGLGTDSRMNVPGVAQGNWLWRIGIKDFEELIGADSEISARFKKLNSLYGRR
ncbi:MAG: 4-alpha-glucanotransferase [Synergistaceae bacterium]|nr:4-alpha-glucanotransferase [Synergistaceae bacterium]